MNWFIKHKFLARTFIIYLIHLIYKGFDLSFGYFTDFTFRGILFSFFFLSLWLLAWYTAEWMNDKITSLRQFYRFIINAVFGYSIALITNGVYRHVDIKFFDNNVYWENNSSLNPELTISLLMFYLLGYITFAYVQSQVTVKEKELKTTQLEKENVIAQYKSLKAQIEPHFLFNSLSVLSSIVHTDANLASEFIVKLSKTLRYVIEKNEFALVPLREELAVINDYFYLLKTRFNDGIALLIEVDEKRLDTVFVPPASIQLLIENAVKHNKQSDENPLLIEIRLGTEYITVQNNLNKISSVEESTSIGLKNIRKRYRLLSGKEVIVQMIDGFFRVKLPVLNQRDHEDFNH